MVILVVHSNIVPKALQQPTAALDILGRLPAVIA